MRAIWIRKHGGPGVLDVREGPDPEPKPGEVRIAVRAAGLNFAEIMARQGLYPDAPKPPCVVGYEGAGVVDRVGAGVTRYREGDRAIFMTRFGAHASSVCVPEAQVYAMPENMTFEEGAAIPVNYLTAHHMLFEIRRLRPGDHVLIHMAAGGVGTAALQLCRTVPGVVTYGTASSGKHDHVRSQGCDHPIDYRTQDYVAEVRRLSQGRGMDLVLDALGGKDWSKGYSLLATSGVLVAFGLANANTGGRRKLLHVAGQLLSVRKYSPMKLMDENRTVAGLNLGHLWDQIPLLTRELEAISELYRAGRIRPHVGGAFHFSQVAEAHAALEYGRNIGKIVLIPD